MEQHATKQTKRWQDSALFLLPLVALLIIFRQVLFEDRLFFDGDSYLYFYQNFRMLAQGHRHVVPWILSGFPLYTSANATWFYPVYGFFFKFFDIYHSYHYLTLLNFILAYIGTYLYARKVKLSFVAAVLAASIFIFSGQLMMWATVIANTNYYWILPFALLLVEKMRKGAYAPLYAIGAGCLLGIGWLSGHVQFVVYIHAFVAMYYIWFCIFKPWRSDGRHAGFAAIWLVVLFAISAAIGWQQIGSVLSFTNQTARSAGVTAAQALGNGYKPQDLVHYVLPFWNTPLLPAPTPNLYLGIFPLLLLLYAFFRYRELGSRGRFFLIAFIFCLLAGIYYSPVGFILHELPLFNSFREMSRLMFIGNFAAAMLIGMVFELLMHEENKEKFEKLVHWCKRAALWVFMPVVLVATILQFFFFNVIRTAATTFFFAHRYAATARLAPEHYRALIDQYVFQTLNSFSLSNSQVLICIALLIVTLYFVHRRSELRQSAVAVALVVVTVLGSVAVYEDHFQTIPRSLAETIPASVAAVAQLENNGAPFRIFSLFPGVTEYDRLVVACPASSPEEHAEFLQALAVPNVTVQYGLESADGYENFMPARIAELLAYAGSERATAGVLLSGQKMPIEERVKEFVQRSDVLRLMNVKYVFSPYRIVDAGFTEVHHEELGTCGGSVYVYQLAGVVPRYFFTNRATATSLYNPAIDEVAAKLQASMRDQGVLLETASTTHATTTTFFALPAQQSADTVTLTVDALTNGYVTVGNAWLPGWRALVDGTATPILRANYIYMAVPVVAGKHEILFHYSATN